MQVLKVSWFLVDKLTLANFFDVFDAWLRRLYLSFTCINFVFFIYSQLH